MGESSIGLVCVVMATGICVLVNERVEPGKGKNKHVKEEKKKKLHVPRLEAPPTNERADPKKGSRYSIPP